MEKILHLFTGCIHDQYLLFKLKLVKNIAEQVSGLVFLVVLAIIVFFFIFFGSVAVALYLGQLTGSQLTGFSLLAGFYLVLILCLLIFRKELVKRPVQNRIIKNLLDDEDGTSY